MVLKSRGKGSKPSDASYKCPGCGGLLDNTATLRHETESGYEVRPNWCTEAQAYPHPPQRSCGLREPGGTICTEKVGLDGLCLRCKKFSNFKLGFDGRHFIRISVSEDIEPVPREESLKFIQFLTRQFRTWPAEKSREYVRELEEKHPDYVAVKRREKEELQEVPF